MSESGSTVKTVTSIAIIIGCVAYARQCSLKRNEEMDAQRASRSSQVSSYSKPKRASTKSLIKAAERAMSDLESEIKDFNHEDWETNIPEVHAQSMELEAALSELIERTEELEEIRDYEEGMADAYYHRER